MKATQGGSLEALDQTVVCARLRGRARFPGGRASFARVAGKNIRGSGRIPVLLPRPDEHVSVWRQQLARLIAQGRAHAGGPRCRSGRAPACSEDGQRPACERWAKAVNDQIREIWRRRGPCARGPSASNGERRGYRAGSSSTFQFSSYRDWGWDDGASPENQPVGSMPFGSFCAWR